jgi:type IV pilus assembly protein PilN
MLIDINLLPEKQKKNYTFVLVLTLLLVATAVVATILYLQYEQAHQRADLMQQQIQDTKLLRTVQEKKLTDYTSSTAVLELDQAISWTEEIPIPTVSLIRHLSGLLPERGYVLNFNYSDAGNVNLTVQFDTSREAAYYLKSLKDSAFIEDVNLSSIVTSSEDDDPEVKKLTNFLLPRYIAQFELLLDKTALKDSEKKEESTP